MKVLCSDNFGNKILVRGNTFYLKLAAEKRERNIGTVVIESDWFHTVREEGHLLIKANAYGFNYQIVSMFKKYRNILLNTPEGNFMVPMDAILEMGDFLWFKKQGFERQIFVTREQLKPFKIPL